MFKLHPRLEEDCYLIGESELSLLLLMNDARYPWFIMVPKRADVTEIFQLSPQDQLQLVKESACLAKALSEAFEAHKINVASLGNVVPQLHIHHIARFDTDPAWPAPVWGHSPATPYREEEKEEVLRKIRGSLEKNFRITA